MCGEVPVPEEHLDVSTLCHNFKAGHPNSRLHTVSSSYFAAMAKKVAISKYGFEKVNPVR
jgi:hypothetical protein